MTDQELIRALRWRICGNWFLRGNGAARRGRKCEKDTHMQAVRVHDADRQSTNYWQQPSGRATRRLYV